MDKESIRVRYESFFGKDFMPLIRQEQAQAAAERNAYAAEFTAFHLGQIDKKLGRLIELMEAQQGLAPDGAKTVPIGTAAVPRSPDAS